MCQQKTPVPQSSARIQEQAIDDDSRKQLELSVPHILPWIVEIRIQNVGVRCDNIELALRRGGEDGLD